MVEQLEKEIACPDLNIRVKKCDASDERQVRELVKDCARELPSVCGVIHAAMVLRVCPPSRDSRLPTVQLTEPRTSSSKA